MPQTLGGGVAGGRKLKAVQIGGASGHCIPAKDFERKIAFEDVATGGSFIVFGHDVDMLSVAENFLEFFEEESCGQCTPCREGTGWMMRVMERLVRGEAEIEEIDMLFDVTKQVEGHTICALGDAAAWPIQGLIRNFRPVIEQRIADRKAARVAAE